MAGETATEADGTHPTGMHSCKVIIFEHFHLRVCSPARTCNLTTGDFRTHGKFCYLGVPKYIIG